MKKHKLIIAPKASRKSLQKALQEHNINPNDCLATPELDSDLMNKLNYQRNGAKLIRIFPIAKGFFQSGKRPYYVYLKRELMEVYPEAMKKLNKMIVEGYKIYGEGELDKDRVMEIISENPEYIL